MIYEIGIAIDARELVENILDELELSEIRTEREACLRAARGVIFSVLMLVKDSNARSILKNQMDRISELDR